MTLCIGENATSAPTGGSCVDAGFVGCCDSSCYVGSCYCDQICHTYGDCCDDIEDIGCFPAGGGTCKKH